MKDVFASLRGLLPSDTLPPPEEFEGPYRVFTREHDLELGGDEIEAVISRFPQWGYYPSPDFDTYHQTHAFEPENLLVKYDTSPSSNCAVTLLLDHSGSLRGDKICFVATLAGLTSSYLTTLGVRHEVLGFTTSSWRGGASAQQWREAGRPNAPGRLCDLLHVVHRTFDDNGPFSQAALRAMTRSGLLKENVDGEALQWAASRLSATNRERNILIVVSDGAPVDDSTLMVNGPNILDDHLKLVTRDLVARGIELYGIGINYEMDRYFRQYLMLSGPNELRSLYLPVLSAILSSTGSAPTPEPSEAD